MEFLLPALVALFGLVVVWRFTQLRRRAAANQRPLVVIDGSNVMYWGVAEPSITPILDVVRLTRDAGYRPGVIFDANAGYLLKDRYLGDKAIAALLGMKAEEVFVVPKGTQADMYILEFADEHSARVISRDRFRDWADKYPLVRETGRLVTGKLRNGCIDLQW